MKRSAAGRPSKKEEIIREFDATIRDFEDAADSKKYQEELAFIKAMEKKSAVDALIRYSVGEAEYKEHFVECGDFHFHFMKRIKRWCHGTETSKDKPFTINQWPRGFGKTQFTVFVFIYMLLMRRLNCAIILSCSEDSASNKLSLLHRIFATSERVRRDLGIVYIKGSAREGKLMLGDKESNEKGIFSHSIYGQVRGINHQGKRPNVLVFDDIDNFQRRHNPKAIASAYKNINSSIIGTTDGQNPLFIILQNYTSQNSLLTQFKEYKKDPITKEPLYNLSVIPLTVRKCVANPKNTVAPFLLTDKEQHESVWPARFTLAQCRKTIYAMGINPARCELYHHPVSDEAVFPESILTVEDEPPLEKLSDFICYTDPAWQVGKSSDHSASVVVAYDRAKKRIFIVGGVSTNKIGYVEQVISLYMSEPLGALCRNGFFIEANGYQKELVTSGFNTYWAKKDFKWAPQLHIDARGNKEQRIADLSKYFDYETDSQMSIFAHSATPKEFVKRLEFEMSAFNPDITKNSDDTLDALQGAISFLTKRLIKAQGEIMLYDLRKEWEDNVYYKHL